MMSKIIDSFSSYLQKKSRYPCSFIVLYNALASRTRCFINQLSIINCSTRFPAPVVGQPGLFGEYELLDAYLVRYAALTILNHLARFPT